MTTEYAPIIKKAQLDKHVAEMRLSAANLTHSASCIERNDELEIKTRQEIHALQDIILDNAAIIFHCIAKQNEQKDYCTVILCVVYSGVGSSTFPALFCTTVSITYSKALENKVTFCNRRLVKGQFVFYTLVMLK